MKTEPSDAAWLNWVTVMRRVASLDQKHDIPAALAELEAFLSQEANTQLRSEALAYRADFKIQLGDFGGAETDLLDAHSLVGASYGRYVRELSLAKLCMKQGRANDVLAWYRTALCTSIDAEGVSAGAALKSFLALRSAEGLTQEDRTLCNRAAELSWSVLGLSGRPNLANLDEAASMIRNGEEHPPRRPSP